MRILRVFRSSMAVPYIVCICEDILELEDGTLFVTFEDSEALKIVDWEYYCLDDLENDEPTEYVKFMQDFFKPTEKEEL
jgi:hypothetical protein